MTTEIIATRGRVVDISAELATLGRLIALPPPPPPPPTPTGGMVGGGLPQTYLLDTKTGIMENISKARGFLYIAGEEMDRYEAARTTTSPEDLVIMRNRLIAFLTALAAIYILLEEEAEDDVRLLKILQKERRGLTRRLKRLKP